MLQVTQKEDNYVGTAVIQVHRPAITYLSLVFVL